MSESGAIIRPIEEKDYEEWFQLFSGEKNSYLVFYKSKVPKDVVDTTFKRFLDDSVPVYCYVAVDPSTGKLIGFANFLTHYNTWTIEPACYLNDLFVSEDSRLKGTGGKLITKIYEFCDENSIKNCYWTTQFENHRAQLLYTKIGKKAGFLKYRRPKPDEKPDYYS
ncbi:unnamed protein product [[Candida] boidinii]|uniref:Unnamed protein product n=1 Tax=Candida boidinii TaxID=5477 RepID=A0A9W6WHE1_CANBO|nr:transferase activity, transferring acyl groups protein [[Candida] boidinii]OWB85806.1 transferase activity, transferring acyl groups protein [[Candida] boidinii]GME72283.1 unnamed protein product [[Candida] boidinii]GMG00636.1 unnamed protein product [[Candida] boidinii]